MATMVIGFFEREGEAREAEDDLISMGVPKEAISVSRPEGRREGSGGGRGHGFWDNVKQFLGFGVSDRERGSYEEGIRRGGAVLAVRAREESEEVIRRTLESHGAVDIDERSTGGTPPAAGSSQGGEVVVPVVEEEVAIGERPVKKGSVRIYKTVEERPVNEQITLREEKVHVERRPADRAGERGGDEDFQSYYRTENLGSDAEYDQHYSAYLFGNEYGQSTLDQPWNADEARLAWEKQGSGQPWDRFQQAVRRGWERARRGGR